MGVGPGMTAWQYPAYRRNAPDHIPLGNEYFTAWGEYGLLGLLILLATGAIFLAINIQILNLRKDRYFAAIPSNRYAFAVGGLAAAAAVLVSAGVGGHVRTGANLLTVAGLAGAVLACGLRHRGDPEAKAPRFGEHSVMRLKGIPRYVLVVALLVLLAVLGSRLYAGYPAELLARLGAQRRSALQWAQAESFYQRAWQLDQNNFHIAADYGDLLAARATWNLAGRNRLSREALRWYDRALTRNPYAHDLLVRKARLHDFLGERDLAVTCLRTALQSDPQNPAYHLAQGVHHLRWQEPALARRSFQRAHELDPRDPAPVHQLQALAEPPAEPVPAEPASPSAE